MEFNRKIQIPQASCFVKKQDTLVNILVALVIVGAIGGCSNSDEKSTEKQDCIYLSELNEDELWDIIERKTLR